MKQSANGYTHHSPKESSIAIIHTHFSSDLHIYAYTYLCIRMYFWRNYAYVCIFGETLLKHRAIGKMSVIWVVIYIHMSICICTYAYVCIFGETLWKQSAFIYTYFSSDFHICLYVPMHTYVLLEKLNWNKAPLSSPFSKSQLYSHGEAYFGMGGWLRWIGSLKW